MLNESGILGYLTEDKSINRFEAGKIDKIYYNLGYLIVNKIPSRVYSDELSFNSHNHKGISNYI